MDALRGTANSEIRKEDAEFIDFDQHKNIAVK